MPQMSKSVSVLNGNGTAQKHVSGSRPQTSIVGRKHIVEAAVLKSVFVYPTYLNTFNAETRKSSGTLKPLHCNFVPGCKT